MMTVRENNFASLQSGLLVPLCLLVALGGAQCYFVQFFQNTNYSGLLGEFHVTGDGCKDLGIEEAVRSIRTDKCLLVYDTSNCDHAYSRSSFSFRLEKDEPNLLSGFPQFEKFPDVRSVIPCGNTEDGVNVDFYADGKWTYYQHVCGCRNILHFYNWGKTAPILVSNNGNSVEMFSEEHCTGKSKIIPAGFSPESTGMWPARDFDIRSFRSANIFNCLKMEASISSFNFESENSTEGDLLKFTESAQLATSAKMRNYNTGKLIQEYSISEKVTNTFDYTVSKGLTKMHKLGYTIDFKASYEVGIPSLENVKAGLRIGVNGFGSWANTVTNTTKKVITNEETVSTRQVIEVPSCSECVATSSLQKVKGYPIKYTAYTRINASDSGRRLEAQELRGILPAGLNYLKDFDEYTVVAVYNDTVTATFALDAFINVDCVPIPGCKAST